MKIAKHTGKRGEKNPSAIRAGKTGSHKNPGKWMANGFLLPSILGVLLFFVLPFFIVIYYSVIDNPINAEFVGFDNFKMVFENADDIFGNSNAISGCFITSSGNSDGK